MTDLFASPNARPTVAKRPGQDTLVEQGTTWKWSDPLNCYISPEGKYLTEDPQI